MLGVLDVFGQKIIFFRDQVRAITIFQRGGRAQDPDPPIGCDRARRVVRQRHGKPR